MGVTDIEAGSLAHTRRAGINRTGSSGSSTEELRKIRLSPVTPERTGVGEDRRLQAKFLRETEDRELSFESTADIIRATQSCRPDIIHIGDVSRADTTRREAADEARTRVEVINDAQIAATQRGDIAALQTRETDNAFIERIIIAAVGRGPEELRIAAKPGGDPVQHNGDAGG